MSSPLLPERTCLWCHTPFLEGRADKKFCKSACKANYSRTVLATDAPRAAPPSRPATPSRPQSISLVDWQTRCEKAEHILQTQEQAAQAALPFDQEYARLEQLIGQYLSSSYSAGMLSYLLLQVEKVLEQYQRHPALSNPLHAAQYRLSHLYMARQSLQAEHRDLFTRDKRH